MNKIIFNVLAVFGLVMLPMLASAAGEVPHYVNFQAVLRDDSGNLITDSSVDLKFKILDQSGNQLYYEQQPGVQVVRSSVNVMIGEGLVPGSDPSTPTGGIPLAALDPASGTKHLQIQFGSNQPSDPMDLNSVPYAVYAEKALGLDASITAADIPAAFATDDEVATAVAAEATARQGGDTNLQSQIDTANGNITNLQGQMSTANSNITTLQSQMTTANTNITNLQTQVSTNSTDISNLQTTVANHETRITALETGAPSQQSLARAWANWCVNGGGNINLLSQYNVSSVTDGGNTDFAVTFLTSMPDALYMMTGSGEDPSNLTGFGAMMIGMNTSKNTASTAYIKGTDKNGNNQFNSRCYRVIFYR